MAQAEGVLPPGAAGRIDHDPKAVGAGLGIGDRPPKRIVRRSGSCAEADRAPKRIVRRRRCRQPAYRSLRD